VALTRPDLKSLRLATAGTFDPTGIWTNELGSTMAINQVSGGQMSGSYSSPVSSEGNSASGPLVGMVAGSALGFVVNWGPLNSVTAWSALVLTDGNSNFLYALWNLADTPETAADWWSSINAGADLFVPMDS